MFSGFRVQPHVNGLWLDWLSYETVTYRDLPWPADVAKIGGMGPVLGSLFCFPKVSAWSSTEPYGESVLTSAECQN
jgi:hypothetical protein